MGNFIRKARENHIPPLSQIDVARMLIEAVRDKIAALDDWEARKFAEDYGLPFPIPASDTPYYAHLRGVVRSRINNYERGKMDPGVRLTEALLHLLTGNPHDGVAVRARDTLGTCEAQSFGNLEAARALDLASRKCIREFKTSELLLELLRREMEQ